MKLKKAVLLIFLAFLITSQFAVAQQNEVVDQIKETIKAGSAKELSKYMNQSVDIMIDEKMDSYSKAQAEFVLRDFFKSHPPSEFNIIHQGSSKGGQPFAIGLYKCNSETYRVFMKIKSISDSQLVHEIRFSKE